MTIVNECPIGPLWLDPESGLIFQDGKQVDMAMLAKNVPAAGLTAPQVTSLQAQVSGDGIFSACQPNAGDQSGTFRAEVAAALAANKTLVLPPGAIDLSGLSSTISVSGLKLRCMSGVASLTAVAPKVTDLFTVIGGGIDIEGVEFKRWNRPIYSTATLGDVRIVRCRFVENRGHITLADRSDFPLSSCESLTFCDNQIIDSPGLEWKGAVGSADVRGNYVLRARRHPDLWAVADHRLYALCIGDHDDVLPSVAQDLTRRVVVMNNIIRGVSNPTATYGFTTNGIVVTALEVDVSHNLVSDVESTGNPADCEGIYTKASWGRVAHNTLVDATRESCAIAIKGKSYGSPIAKALHVSHNLIRADGATNSLGIIIFGTATDVHVTDNRMFDLADGGVVVYGSPVRNHVRRNTAVRCGGIPIYWACGDIVDCSSDDNEVIDQVLSTASDVARTNNPYPDTGTHDTSGICVKAIKGAVASYTVTGGGSGYLVNGSPDGACFVQVSGGDGTGAAGYASFVGGALVAVTPTGAASGYTVAPTVNPDVSVSPGVTITRSGSAATVTTQLTTGSIDTFSASRNKFRGSYAYSASTASVAYECVTLYNETNSTTKALRIDGIDAKIDGSWAAGLYYIYGVSLKGSGFPSGYIGGISMLGDNTGRRQQPWRAISSTKIAQYSVAGTQLIFGDAQVFAGPMIPLPLLYVTPNRARLCISFQRFTSASTGHFLGTIPSGNLDGQLKITKVTPRYVLQSGGAALSAASGTPTVAVATTTGGGDLMPATGIASLASATSPVDGAAANEVLITASSVSLYLVIAGGSINSNSRSFLMLDIEYTVTA